MLDLRGHRAVPVASSDEGVDLVQRMRFDVSFCSMHVESLNWVQFFQRVRHNVGAFVLLSEGHDPDLARIFDGGGGYLLQKPIEDADLDGLLHNIDTGVNSGAMAGNG
jgi:CheY-like chemotaxis protein